jgi:hypothetical protein
MTHSRSRRGISLLEIMISIGIVGIGLIGVASLIPLAHYKAAQGVQEERKALFGKRAYREFFVHGFDRPGWWVGSGGTPYWLWLGTGQNPYYIYASNAGGQIIRQSYCFDPLLVAAALKWPANDPLSKRPMPFRGTFPDALPPAAQLPRITVLSYRPEDFRDSLLMHGATPVMANLRMNQFVNNFSAMSLTQADEVFRLHDDVVVEPPANPNDIAELTQLKEPAGGNGPPLGVKRLSGGGFSWMATLVPELTSGVAANNPVAVVPYVSNRYRLSIVVFNQRDLTGRFAEEVVARVLPPPDSQLAGAAKDIVISEIGPDPPIAENVGVRNIRQGDWIALLQKMPMPLPLGEFTQLQWYQVVSTDEPLSESTLVRQLSLNGPDWTPVWNNNFPVYAVYVRNVQTVFEKTIELKE